VLGSIKLIDKTHHRSIFPSFKKLERVLEKGRYVTLALLIVIALVSYLGQSSNEFLYGGGDNQLSEKSTIAIEETEKVFGKHNKVVLMVPRGYKINESKMVKDLSNEPYIDNVQGMYSLVDPEIPDHMIPDMVKDQFLSENYSRYMLNLNTDIETPRSIAAIESINKLVSKYYNEYHMTGETPNVVDMRDVSKSDFFIVTIVSIAAVGVILLITFKSISIPLILLAIIEVSIWINMSISYFSGSKLLFLGYLIVTALQLGATIDYAILLTNRYVDSRKSFDTHTSAIEAITKAGQSILTSSGILGVAGLTISIIFGQATLKELGLLVGRGAIISGLMVFLVLPQLLVIFDKFIGVTTYKWAGIKEQHSMKGSAKQ
jgi:predicted RND superfamily exporter protein